MGYNVFDDYDLGNKQQFMSTPTRYGSRERLQRCTAIMRANGLDVYLDIVMHQRNGGSDFTYSYLGANGKAGAGRFPKHKTCFCPNVPRDPIAGPISDDFPFGDELAPINALPKDYVKNALMDAVDWQTRTRRRARIPARRHQGHGGEVCFASSRQQIDGRKIRGGRIL